MAAPFVSTSKRTLHYYWQVTRNHLGLFIGVQLSTFLYVALLSYGNPLCDEPYRGQNQRRACPC